MEWGTLEPLNEVREAEIAVFAAYLVFHSVRCTIHRRSRPYLISATTCLYVCVHVHVIVRRCASMCAYVTLCTHIIVQAAFVKIDLLHQPWASPNYVMAEFIGFKVNMVTREVLFRRGLVTSMSHGLKIKALIRLRRIELSGLSCLRGQL